MAIGTKMLVVFEHATGLADINRDQLAGDGTDVYLESKKVLPEKLIPDDIVTGKQIGRASCRERVSSPV